ncbi:hypothetical protein HPP92_029021, partial [Vanilla planifolia]
MDSSFPLDEGKKIAAGADISAEPDRAAVVRVKSKGAARARCHSNAPEVSMGISGCG